ncbi:Rrf2 family transcriptional regulator, partial [Aminobacterium sp. EBM-42]
MKLSTKTRYGLRALLELARQYDGRTPLSITDIASKENISERYLEQLFLKLRRDGLIESVRGPQGGYLLSRAPMEITVAEVVEVLEGNIQIADCLEGPECMRESACPARKLWL